MFFNSSSVLYTEISFRHSSEKVLSSADWHSSSAAVSCLLIGIFKASVEEAARIVRNGL